jgi:hypothetical protein
MRVGPATWSEQTAIESNMVLPLACGGAGRHLRDAGPRTSRSYVSPTKNLVLRAGVASSDALGPSGTPDTVYGQGQLSAGSWWSLRD